MADHFTRVASKRQVRSKLPRDPSSGQFERPGPLTDPMLKGQAVNAIRACDDLRPFLAVLVEGLDEPGVVMVARCLLEFQDTLKATLLGSLEHDPDAVYEAKRKRVPFAIVPRLRGLS